MDFKQVFRCLQDVFPQVDSRILKAVAIEHSEDVNGAVEFILYEVLQTLNGPSEASCTMHDTREVEHLSNDVQLRERNATLGNYGAEAVIPELIACGTVPSDDSVGFMSPCLGEVVEVSHTRCEGGSEEQYRPHHDDNASNVQEFQGLEAKETVIDVETNNHYLSLLTLESGTCPYLIENGSVEAKDINRSVNECEEQLSRCSFEYADTVSAALKSACDEPSSVSEKIMDLGDCGAEVLKDIDGAFCETEEHHPRGSAVNCSEQLAYDIEMISLEENNQPMIMATRSGNVVNIELLEDFVTDAKSNKKILVSAVESVVDMMKEAELLEEKAKQAKEDASSAGQDILSMVEELKQMLKHAKQANDMHAGEVYGEKAILSTEARELQSRLLSLSDERNKSISIIEEIRGTLETRVSAAEKEIAAAEQEKHEKEGLAQKALKELEAIMDATVQESKQLQLEAEENSKLREFLVDRGRVVDALQGEIAVICEDVMLVKERVDGRMPLSRSLLMTTYSSASSSSASIHKSSTSFDRTLHTVELGPSSEDHSRRQEQENILSSSAEMSDASDKQKLPSDDEWVIY